jgi:uncharacterized membrane-anchored protein YhcB (DUF1043 family)
MTPDKHTFFQSLATSSAVAAVLAFFGKRELRRVDKLESEILKKEEFDQYRAEWNERHNRMEDKLDRLIERNTRQDKR